ncbi:uncharacterized protein BYT42DRAFT_575553 [Radiomyces spectabilis]|uniref:uncharacterized protein n=1 Tax=Radiomyces spectabilis TaxID=64574 RepID=UPI00221EAC14|nr:uncharacterized protein BYT42DRAFT_575553 [Radiomyces spectabilis]KAI8374228.1 hypothetical protein BYT42DRAFT_575553 [Radiomyces spectabilis]
MERHIPFPIKNVCHHGSIFAFLGSGTCLQRTFIISLLLYPSLESATLDDMTRFSNHCILAPTNRDTDAINSICTNRFPGQEKVYLCADVALNQENTIPPELLAALSFPVCYITRYAY